MKFFATRILFLVSLALILSPAALAQTNQSQKTLNNAAVVKLTKAGFKEKTIISIIYSRMPNFDLSPDRMIELKRNGVSEKIIVAMLARQEGMDPFDDDSWGDEEFITKGIDPTNSSPSTGGNNGGNSGNGGGTTSSDPGTNIFGSSGGARGRTKSNMGNGGIDNDIVTTGSATVKILRPPSETGGAGGPVKLEKTKSLTNESIVELVEAGFSEGTIIRRIEQSPVEFDLSETKLDDLRKRRVSERVVAAMKAAMGTEVESKPKN
jgi:hypothetical protein